jgi:hypothetical protein
MSDYIELVCIKEGSKLRVRILTNGYYNQANCQFPRALRIEGRKFRVKCEHINLITSRGKYFYSVKKKEHIEILDEEVDELCIDLKSFQIYDSKMDDCAICLSNTKTTVFYPCGHYYCCSDCSYQIKKCPICRKDISKLIEKSKIN